MRPISLILSVLAVSAALSVQAETPGGILLPKSPSAGASVGKVTENTTPDRPLIQPWRSAGNLAYGGFNAIRRTPTVSSTQAPAIYGGVVSSADPAWDENTTGVYLIPNGSSTTSFTKLFSGSGGQNAGGGAGAGAIYYSVRHFSYGTLDFVTIYGYNTETWEEEFIKTADKDLVATDLSYDPVSEQIYGCFYSKTDKNFHFATADLRAGTRTDIAQVEKWNAFAIDRNGNAFAINLKGELLKVDKSTGATAVVGDTGIIPFNNASATFDYRSGKLYWTVSPGDGTGALYTVDPETAATALVVEFPYGEQVTGLWIPAPEAADDAPDAVSGLTADFPEGSLSGNLRFTAPESTFGGESLGGTLDYTVTVNGEQEATGSCNPGADCAVPLAVPEAGNYDFVVTVANAAGTSPRAKLSAFIGKGVPAAPEAEASYAGGKFTVKWKPVTGSADGGYINPAEVTYTVKMYPGGTDYTTGDTSVEISMEEPDALTSFYFEVTAGYAGLTSASSRTGSIALGSLLPPFAETYETDDNFDLYTVIDGNHDGRTWEWLSYTGGNVRANYGNTDCDDWLITPPIKLSAGFDYSISVDLFCHNVNYPETVEIYCGTSPSVEGMDVCLLSPTVVDYKTPRTHKFNFKPEADGKYYIGIHQITKADQYYLYIDNLTVNAGVSPVSPSAPGDFKAVADPSGENRATITFRVPSASLEGDPLESVSRIELKRDGELIHTFRDPAPGAELSFTDTAVGMGKHTYSAVAYSGSAEGKEARAEVFVGVNVPGPVTNLRISESPASGHVTLEWDAPATDKDGNPINPEFITYTIYDVNDETVAEDVAATSWSGKMVDDGDQQFARMGVAAVTRSGASGIVASAMIPVGTPYPLPYGKSFSGGSGGLLGVTAISGTPAWAVTGDNKIGQLVSQDDDDALLVMTAETPGACGAVYTGKIAVEGCSDPKLSFYVYQFLSPTGERDDTNTLEIEVRDVDAASDYVSVAGIVNNELDKASEGWCRVVVPLSAYAGRTVQIRFKATINSYGAYAIDNIVIGDLPVRDLKVTSLSAPETAEPGVGFNLTVRVLNKGIAPASGASVELFRAGERVASVSLADLAAGETASVTFSETLSLFSDETNEYSAKVVYEGDENIADNESAVKSVRLMLPDYPAVSGLEATGSDAGIDLRWDAIDLTKEPVVKITDSFEDYVPFAASSPGEWKFIDRDGGSTGIIYDLGGVNELYSGMPLAFTVMDAANANLNETFRAATGTRYLAAFYNNDSSQNDDWAISPRLSGKAQTISFKAKSYNITYGIEPFEVLYSTGNLDPDNFVKVKSFTEETGAWQEFSADLPDGAVYAAIRYTGYYQYIFFIDDFAYMPASLADRLTHLGYNVYRDGVKLNSEPLGTPSFSDPVADTDSHVYNVTAVYDKGESPVSASVTASRLESGIAEIEGSTVGIAALPGAIAITGCAGLDVEICSGAGIVVAKVHDAPGSLLLPVAPGVYIVKAGAAITKVAVR